MKDTNRPSMLYATPVEESRKREDLEDTEIDFLAVLTGYDHEHTEMYQSGRCCAVSSGSLNSNLSNFH